MAASSGLGTLAGSLQHLVSARARPPLWARLGPERVDEPFDDSDLDPRRDYVEVRINRLYFARRSQWFSQFTPVVLAAVEFAYDGGDAVVPTMVGPGLVRRVGGSAPQETVVAGTRVAGPFPAPPGGIALSVVLYRLQIGNSAQAFLDVMQSAAGALDLVAGLAPCTALAKVVVKGVDALVGGDRPVLARRDDLGPGLRPAYYALVDPSSDVAAADLYVTGGELTHRVDGRLVPFTDADYVLYSVNRVAARHIDLARLPLYRVWQDVVRQATEASTAERWLSTKTTMATLSGLLHDSPDLTWEHAEALREEWIETMLGLRARALRLADLAAGQAPLDPARSRALAVLDL